MIILFHWKKEERKEGGWMEKPFNKPKRNQSC
jgi:hypothetical protein